MKLRLFLCDNYDSFTFNLVHVLHKAARERDTTLEIDVARNDATTVDAVVSEGYDAWILSPGPCTPAEAGLSVPLVRAAIDRVPLLGVCLGHQSIGAALGARIVRAPAIVHGKASHIRHDGLGIFAGLTPGFPAMRYHSLVIDPATLPAQLVATAWTGAAADGSGDPLIMGVRRSGVHAVPLEGVQFHPESVGSPDGHCILGNFLTLVLRRVGGGEA